MEAADLDVLFLKDLQATGQGKCHFQLVLVRQALAARFGVVKRRLHLPYRCDHLLCLIDHFLLLRGYGPYLIVERF
jgi:hypothetical protein